MFLPLSTNRFLKDAMSSLRSFFKSDNSSSVVSRRLWIAIVSRQSSIKKLQILCVFALNNKKQEGLQIYADN